MVPGMPHVVGTSEPLKCSECNAKIPIVALSFTVQEQRVCLRRRCIENAIAKLRRIRNTLEAFARGVDP